MTTLVPAPPGLEFMSRLSLPQLCGQLLVVGFDGSALPGELATALSAGLRAGVIFFRRNLPNIEAAWSLCRAIHSASQADLVPLISLDQEGGRVTRLPHPVRALPAMRTLGMLKDVDFIQRASGVVARGLAVMGFNCNYAPVLDVDSNPKNPVIGDRSFSADPRKVAHMGLAFARGLSKNGILSCGKHFPGHGDTDLDSHLALPTVNRSRAQLETNELLPFREAVAQRIDALMTAHVVYPALDPSCTPATISPSILTDLLRNQWGYRGLVFSDDLCMKALNGTCSLDVSAKRAVRAGCDLLLICHGTAPVDDVLDALVREAEMDPAFSARVWDAAQRSLAARRRFPPRPALQLSAIEHVLLGEETRQLFAELDERLKALST
jgi:beta-N-acetylhexosaminidase